MRYLLSMILSFASGAFQVVVAAELAANAGESALSWLGVAILGCILFYQTCVMALGSVAEERAVQLEAEAGR